MPVPTLPPGDLDGGRRRGRHSGAGAGRGGAPPLPHVKPRIVVVGSLNVDLIARVPALPVAGETIFASEVVRRLGGKGANQALAAARLGAEVELIGAVGD